MKNSILMIAFCLFQVGVQAKLGTTKSKLLWPNYDSENAGFNPQRIIFGSNLGMDFINQKNGIQGVVESREQGVTAFLDATLGYRFGSRYVMGVNAGLGYTYLKIDYKNKVNVTVDESYILKFPSYRASFFNRFFVSRNLFLHVEPEINIRQNWVYDFEPTSAGKLVFSSTKIQVPCVLSGIGLVFPIGDRTAIVLQGLYDVLQNEDSPYSNLPIIRGGVSVGNY